jgi:hypothetical protein
MMLTSARRVDRWILGLLVDQLLGETVDDAGPMPDGSCRAQIKALSREIAVNTLDRLAVERSCCWRWHPAGRAILAAWLRRASL